MSLELMAEQYWNVELEEKLGLVVQRDRFEREIMGSVEEN